MPRGDVQSFNERGIYVGDSDALSSEDVFVSWDALRRGLHLTDYSLHHDNKPTNTVNRQVVVKIDWDEVYSNVDGFPDAFTPNVSVEPYTDNDSVDSPVVVDFKAAAQTRHSEYK